MDDQEKINDREKRTEEDWHNILPKISKALNDIFKIWDCNEGETISALLIFASKYAHEKGLNIDQFDLVSRKISMDVYRIQDSPNKSEWC